MDPLAHTLLGACLAESGLKRKSPLSTATLLIGANAPDIDAFVRVAGSDVTLHVRRGWTHGILAMAVLPVVVASVMVAWDRGVRRRRKPEAEPARFGPLLGLAAIAVLSHPALDWLNTYGVRLLMPFDDRWFYGDALMIVDPWMWLLTAASVVMARSKSKPGIAAWIILGCATTALVLGSGLASLGVEVFWVAGVAAIAIARTRRPAEPAIRRTAVACLAVLGLYVGAMVLSSAHARQVGMDWVAGQGEQVIDAVASPARGDPFQREVVVRTAGGYRILWVVLWGGVEERGPPIPLGYEPRVDRALDRIPGMRAWLRLPAYEVEETAGGLRVIVRDLRYSRRERSGFGTAVVDLSPP